MIREAKAKLRIQVKKRLSQLSNESINYQSGLIAEKLKQFQEFQRCKNIALYVAMEKEVQTREIIESCFKLGKNVYLPRCTYDMKVGRKLNHLDMIKVQSFSDVMALIPRGRFRLKEPIEGDNALQDGLDMIIIPGVAFDLQKGRIGHGAGFYDEFLSVYYKKFGKLPYLIGVGFKEQLVGQIPLEDHDWKLDCIVTPDQTLT